MPLAGNSYSDVSSLTSAQQTARTTTANSTLNSQNTQKVLEQLGANFNQMLQMLTTQLKNQDPSKPMDPTEMTNQLVSMTNVQQTVGINARLDRLLAMEQNRNAGSMLGYMGRRIEWEGNKISLANGTAAIGYEMSAAGSAVRLEVLDSNGQVVKTFSGDPSVGAHQLTWDGTNTAGTRAADGTYTIRASTEGISGGAAPTVKTRSSGLVSSIDSSGGDTTLHVGTQSIPVANVLAIMS